MQNKITFHYSRSIAVRLYIIIFICISFNIKGQNFNKKDLINTEWFTDNKDSIFFKKDTIKLIKYSHKSKSKFSNIQTQYLESPNKYLGHSVYVNLGFKRHRDFSFLQNNWHLSISHIKGILSWNYDKKKNMILIYKYGSLDYKLKILTFREIEVETNEINPKRLNTLELTVVRVR